MESPRRTVPALGMPSTGLGPSGRGDSGSPARDALALPGGDGRSTTGPTGPGPVVLSERTLKLIRRYARPDHRGWVMAPADILYRLRAWHGVEITRDQLAEVLR